jgi:cytochrome P450
MSSSLGLFYNKAYEASLEGPIVRVSPTEIHVNDIPAVKEIHKVGSPYLKSDWYYELTSSNVETIFNTTNPSFHSRIRKLLSGPISDANLKQYEPIITDRIRLTMHRIGMEMETRGAADMFKWATFFATDIIGELSFGESFKMLERGEVSLPCFSSSANFDYSLQLWSCFSC